MLHMSVNSSEIRQVAPNRTSCCQIVHIALGKLDNNHMLLPRPNILQSNQRSVQPSTYTLTEPSKWSYTPNHQLAKRPKDAPSIFGPWKTRVMDRQRSIIQCGTAVSTTLISHQEFHLPSNWLSMIWLQQAQFEHFFFWPSCLWSVCSVILD